MSAIDKAYHSILQEIAEDGVVYDDPKREGVTRIQVPVTGIAHDLEKSFPAISTKKLAWRSVVVELIWFLRGDSNIKYLVDNKCNIWNKDAYNHYCNLKSKLGLAPLSEAEFINRIRTGKLNTMHRFYKLGDLGPVYGALWRNFNGVDQLQEMVTNMINEPMSTDHIVTAWDPSKKKDQALPPCHFGFQVMCEPLSGLNRFEHVYKHMEKSGIEKAFTVEDIEKFNVPHYVFALEWSQRSVDTFLGLPFNIASYALLAEILGVLTNIIPKMLVGDLRNVHLYDNSFEASREQLLRDVNKHAGCKLVMSPKFMELAGNVEENAISINPVINALTPEMFTLDNYTHEPAIKVPMLGRS